VDRQAGFTAGSAWSSSSLCLLLLRGVGEQGCHSQFRAQQPGLCSRQDLSFPSSLRPGSACSSLPTDRPAMAILAPFCSPRRSLQHQIEPAAQSRHYSADSTCTPDAIYFICCNCKRQRMQRKAGFDGVHHSIGVHCILHMDY
jgi:hypothetical protein